MELEIRDADELSRGWWTFLIRGAVGVLFGALTLLAPGVSAFVLVLGWGALAMMEGAMLLTSSFFEASGSMSRWLMGLHGLVGIAAGIATFVWTDLTIIALVYLMSAWLAATALFETIVAMRWRRAIPSAWVLAARGLLALALAAVLAFFPVESAIVLVLWVGAFALVSGVGLIALSFWLRPPRTSRHQHNAAHAHV